MDGCSEPVGAGAEGRLRAEVARLARALDAERRERAALLARLEAAQATQHETVLLLGRFLAAREREKAEWQAALERERARAERPVIDGVATVTEAVRTAAPGRPTAGSRPAKPPAKESKRSQRGAEAGADDDFANSPILTFDHVERPPVGARRGLPAPAAEAGAVPVPAAAGAARPLPLLPRIEPLARLGQAAREGLARLKLPRFAPPTPE